MLNNFPLTVAFIFLIAASAGAQPTYRNPELVLTGHSAAITDVATSEDVAYIATGSLDGTARLWTTSGAAVYTLDCGSPVSSVSFNTLGTLLVTGSADSLARLWDVASGTLVNVFRGHGAAIRSVEFHPLQERVLTFGADGTIVTWKANDGTIERRFAPVVGGVPLELTTARFDLLTGSPGRVDLWDGTSLALSRTYPLRTRDSVHAVVLTSGYNQFYGDERFIAVAGATLTIFNTTSKDTVVVTAPSTQRDVALRPGGWIIVTVGDDGFARLWDGGDGSSLGRCDAGGRGLTSVAYMADGTRFVTGGRDGRALVWSVLPPLRAVAPGVSSVFRRGDTVRIRWAGMVPFDSTRVEIADSGTAWRSIGEAWCTRQFDWLVDSTVGKVRFRVTRTTGGPERLRELFGARGSLRGIELTPDDSLVVTFSHDGWARVYALSSGRMLSTFKEGSGGPLTTGRVFPDGRRAVITDNNHLRAYIWDLATGRRLATLTGHTAMQWDIEVSPGGERLVTVSGDRTLRVWDTTGTPLTKLTESAGLLSAHYSHDGSRLLTSQRDDVLALRDPVTGARLTTAKGGGGLAFTPDDRLLIGGGGGYFYVLDAATLTGIRTMRFIYGDSIYYNGGIHEKAFVNESDSLVWLGTDFGTCLWNYHRDTAIAVIPTPAQAYAIDITRDNSRLVSAHEDWIARVHDLRRREPLRDSIEGIRIVDGFDDGRLVDFGAQYVGAVVDSTIWAMYENPLSSRLTIDSARIEGDGARAFKQWLPTPRTYSTRASITATLQFAPDTVGWFGASLLMFSRGDVIRIPLLGRGLDPLGGIASTPGGAMGIDRVWPSPARDRVQVTLRLAWTSSVVVELVDAGGTVVSQSVEEELTAGLHHRSIDLEGLSSGRYLLRVRGDGIADERPMFVIH